MPDGSKWDIPAIIIAKSRARYYESKEKGCYKEEYDYTMNNDTELQDWAENNMNWEDIEPIAEKIKNQDKEFYFQEGWINGEKEIVIN